MSKLTTYLVGFVLMGLLIVPPAHAQPFPNPGTGVHGPFPPVTLPANTSTIEVDLTGRKTGVPGRLTFFDSSANSLGTATMPNAPNGFPDGIFQVTTFNLPAVAPGPVTLKFVPNDANTPVTILATGDVTINGTIDVSGSKGQDTIAGSAQGGSGGPGGFKGGNGESSAFTGSGGGGDGLGPGAGVGGGTRPGRSLNSNVGGSGAGFGFAGGTDSSGVVPGGGVYGTPELLPLLGGSGGGGGCLVSGRGGAGGGGGGGAILLVSPGTITVGGSVLAKGGDGGLQAGGGGSGGAIRLVANTLAGNGTLNAAGGAGGGGNGCFNGGSSASGRIRLESFFSNNFTAVRTGNTSSSGPGPILFTNAPSISITRIVGATPDPVVTPPKGGFGFADVSVSAPGTFTIVLQTSRVPVGSGVCVTAKAEANSQPPVTTSPCPTVAADGSVTATLTLGAGGKYFIEARANFTIQ